MNVDVAILGCGWAGISASYIILEEFPNVDIVCIDKDVDLGGLLKTIIVNGFVFDVGGSHVIFSRDREILQEMLSFLETNFIEHHRRAYIYLDDIYIPYPFENGIWALPSEKRAEILVSFIEALIERAKDPAWKPRNLREWIYGFFGREIAKLYLEPYNVKIWKRSLEEIGIDWVYTPGRLPIPDWRDVIRAGAGIPTEGYREQARFFYPLKGGIQSLYNAALEKVISKGLRIIKGMKIERIRKVGDRWIINDSIETKKLISTIPLNELVETLDAPQYVLKLSKELDYNSIVVIGIALKKKAPNMHWIYVPDKDIIFHRFAWISNYSPYNTPNNDEYASIIVEITVPPNKDMNPDELMEKTVEGLKKLSIVSESERELLFAKMWFHKYGYPVHTIASNRARKETLRYLSQCGIIALGRWGTWRYLNMDKVFKEAKILKRLCLINSDSPTL